MTSPLPFSNITLRARNSESQDLNLQKLSPILHPNETLKPLWSLTVHSPYLFHTYQMCPSGTTAAASSARTSDLRRAFDVIDTDRDGLISRDDLRSFFSAAYHDHDDELLDTMITVADSDGDGLVEFGEFERVISKIEGGRKNGEISGSRSGAGAGMMEEAFRLMDTDGDGRLSHGDLKRFLSSSGFDASDEDVTGMLILAGGDDPAARGVSFDDFLSILAVFESS